MSGTQLPIFAAAAGGLFAEYELDVELVDVLSTQGRYGLSDFAERIRSVARGDVDFGVSAVAYMITAQTEEHGSLGARFAAVLHQTSSVGGLVRSDSDLRRRQDLPGRRVARGPMPWFLAEYEAGLAELGLGAPEVVDLPEGLSSPVALAQGDVDVLPGYAEMAPVNSKAGVAVRAVPLDIEVYASGLVAGDHLPLDVVSRMKQALVAGFELQREQPEVGIAAYRRRFPNIPIENIRASWSLFEPYCFSGPEPGCMDAGRWKTTIEYTAAAHGRPPISPDRTYWPELLSPAGVKG